jgi:ribosomal protein S18 acetylase RimI-like enzyme
VMMGCAVVEGENWIEVAGPPPGALCGVEVDLRDMPDTAQTLAAIAPFANSQTVIRGIASARLKETDRVAAMCTELARLGVTVAEQPDGLVIQSCSSIRPAVVKTYDDHRMAMAFALVGLRAPGIEIENPDCVSKTFPDYFSVLERLRLPLTPSASLSALTLRRATPEDYDGLCALMQEVNEVHRQHHPQIFRKPAGPIWEKETLLNSLRDDRAAVFVADIEGHLMGFVHVLVKEPPAIPVMTPRCYAHIDCIVVAATARRRGVGRGLLEQAHTWAEAQGAASVDLTVFDFNEDAIAFYRELGYETLSRKMSRPLGSRR